MSCQTIQVDLQACCPSQENYEKIEMNFSCDIDLSVAPYNTMVIVWTGNTSTPIQRRGIKSCYRITSTTNSTYNPNAFSVDSNYLFSGLSNCVSCSTIFPCGDDLTCKPCIGVTSYPYDQNVLTNVCQPSSCFNWDNPIVLLPENSGRMVSKIALNVGTNTGNIDFTFGAGWRPNRFQIWWDYDGSLGGQAGMTKVCDSLFIGDGLRNGTGFRDDTKNYWRSQSNNNPIGEPVYSNCLYGCDQTKIWTSTLSPQTNNQYPRGIPCLVSGFTQNEIDNQGFLALRTRRRDANWGGGIALNFPWGYVVPQNGSPGQIGVVYNYPTTSSPSSSSPIKLRFNKPLPTPSVVYIVSYRGFYNWNGNDAAYLLQVDGACN
jgi:hypothetical protein